MNVYAVFCILDRDMSELARTGLDYEWIINSIKNNLEALTFFLQWIQSEHLTRFHNIFSSVKDMKTFDLYKQYGLEPCGLSEEDVTLEQYQYLTEICFTPATYCLDCYLASKEMDGMMCRRCADAIVSSQLVQEEATLNNFVKLEDGRVLGVVLICSRCKVELCTFEQCEACLAESVSIEDEPFILCKIKA